MTYYTSFDTWVKKLWNDYGYWKNLGTSHETTNAIGHNLLLLLFPLHQVEYNSWA